MRPANRLAMLGWGWPCRAVPRACFEPHRAEPGGVRVPGAEGKWLSGASPCAGAILACPFFLADRARLTGSANRWYANLSLTFRRAHNPKVAGSNPAPATKTL